jgi:hypothetical protein
MVYFFQRLGSVGRHGVVRDVQKSQIYILGQGLHVDVPFHFVCEHPVEKLDPLAEAKRVVVPSEPGS